MADLDSFLTAVLRQAGLPTTPQNLESMRAWQRAEGGWTNNTATYNPLNTTRGSQFPTMNSHNVRQFPNFQTGVQYTAETLGLPYYEGIRGALQQSSPLEAFAQAVYSSPWGTKRGIAGIDPARGGAVSAQAPSAQAPGPVPRPADPTGPGSIPWGDFISAAQTRDVKDRVLQLVGMVSMDRSQQPLPHQAPDSPVAQTPSAFSGVVNGDYAQMALGGAKFSDLGGPQAHQGRPLGNWQSDNAWDYGVSSGTPVYAVTDGVIGPNFGVQPSRPNDGARLTLIAPDNQYWYGHLSRITVKPGQRVKAGELLGYSGASMNGAEHLHLGVRDL